ncbi:MAG: thioredoxin domain-containing protein [Devosia sp.]
MKLNRRDILVTAAVASAATVAGWSPAAFAAEGDMVDINALMAPDGVPDHAKGNADAKVTLIEYASPTCPHCAAFSNDVLPAFEAAYVETGKVRFILRPFARNTIDAAIFLLAEAAAKAADGGTAAADPAATSSEMSTAEAPAAMATYSEAAVDAYHRVIATFFKTQGEWGTSQTPYDALLAVATQLGFSKETFDATLKDQAGFEAIQKMRDQALNAFKLEGTPTFYLNGKTLSGEKSLEMLAAEIDPLLV